LWCSFKLWWNFCLDLSRSKFCSLGNRSIVTISILSNFSINGSNHIAELTLHVNEDINVIGFRENGLWIPVSYGLNHVYDSFLKIFRTISWDLFLTINLLFQGFYDTLNPSYTFVKDW
jgi:hypothetical protein